MENPFARKLQRYAPLGDEDRRLLDDVVRSGHRVIETGASIIAHGDKPTCIHLVLSGVAVRYKLLADGERHIVAYMVPGDFCDLYVFILRRMDHYLSAMSPCEIVDISSDRLDELTARPAIARALRWSTLVDEAVLREWLVNVGARLRTLQRRIAHWRSTCGPEREISSARSIHRVISHCVSLPSRPILRLRSPDGPSIICSFISG